MKDKYRWKKFFCASAAVMLLQQLYLPISYRTYADTLKSVQSVEEKVVKNINQNIGNTQGNLVNGGLLAVTEDYIYYCDDGLYRIKHDGTGKERIAQVGTEEINVIGEWIYCRKYDDENAYIYKMKTDGSNKTRLSDDITMHMFVVGNWIYYKNNSDSGKLYKIDINGMNKTKICDDTVYDMKNYFGFMTVSDDYIYYFVQDNDINLYRINVDGTQRTNLSHQYFIDFDLSQSIQVVDGWIYYGGDNGLYKVKTDGSGNIKICEDAWCYNVTGNNIYFMGEQNKVEKIRTDGSGREIVVFDDRVDFFYAFEDYVYYFKNRELQKRNTNPQHKAEVVGVDDITYNINKNEDIYFPENVKAKMNDGSTQFVDVQWQNKNMDTSAAGVYKFKGVIQGYDRDVILTVNVATINTYSELMEAVRGGKKDFIIGNTYLEKSYNKAVEIVNELISDNMLDIEKEIILHDYVVNTTVYDTENYLKRTYGQSLGILEALSEDGRAVCAGYARALELLLNLAGVECYYVTGNTTTDPHAWNVVKIDGEYYNVDATWDDPPSEDNKIRYDYFNLSDTEISKDHFIYEESFKKYQGSGSNKYKILREVLNLESESLKSQRYYKDGQYIYYIMDESLNKIDIDNLNNINIEKGNILRMTVKDEWIYYVMDDECYTKTLYKVKKDGTQKTKLGKLPKEQCSVDYLISDGEALYLSVNDWESEKVYRMDLEDYSVKLIVAEGASYMAVYDECIYYSNKADGNKLYKIQKDGFKKSKLSDFDVWNLGVIEGYLYYDTGHAIYSIKNSSQHGRRISGDRIEPIWLAKEHTEILADYIYYANSSDGGMLYRIKKDGTDIKRVDNNEVGIREICQDGEYIYYTNYSSDLFSKNLNCKNKKKLTTNFNSNMCSNDDWIYYIGIDEEYVQKLYKVDKNGRKVLQLTEEKVWDFKVGKDYIYYTDGKNILYRIGKNGENKQVVCDDEVYDYIVKNNSVYYVKYNERLFNNEIIKINENCEKQVIYHDDYIASKFYIMGNSIYYNDRDYNVYSVDMSKSEDRNFICNAYVSSAGKTSFYVCEDYIYFRDYFDKSVYRVKKDGSQLTKICGAASNIIGVSDSELYYVSDVKKEKLKLSK